MPTRSADDQQPSSDLVFHQPQTGYRYSLDPFLLASFVRLKRRERVIDLGCGVGVIGLLLAARFLDCEVRGIEIQRRLFEYAVKNAGENRLDARVASVCGDYRSITDYFERSSFSAAVANPPYRPLGTGRRNKDEESAVARHEVTGGLTSAVVAAAAVVRPAGRIFLIYDAEKCADLLTTLRSSGFEPKRARFVHATAESDARMVMVEARRGAGVQTIVMPPLFVWRAPGVYTDEVARMLTTGRPNTC
jgi:tRNA1Val (adenine37-N6)-methyltransferase